MERAIFKTKRFKDGQVSAAIEQMGDLHVKIRGNTYEELFEAAAIKEAFDSLNTITRYSSKLTIYCLIGQRSDRRFEDNQSFDLKMISNFVNLMNYDQVELLHPHSSVAVALINNSKEISPDKYVEKAFNSLGNPVLISPDAGAYKNTFNLAEKLNARLIASNKIRIDGEPKIEIYGNVDGLKCLIVDDIADGGRTFIELAKKLKSCGAAKVYLYVTHGMFNYGFEELKNQIDHIYCTNSFKDITNHEFVTQYEN
ncbi:phosphoribosyltransferase [Nonlabens spongiae]|uniref:Phosphoribosyltransferase n=1 Tax=Nonlabens spongiae TaxID=331648 RepID=A0A1W6MHN5_9FLAO|nr:phosphoribosyltransferase family protein [Nonlabens spongiae]ARN77087.1 phosphoribosyltransferase [Nonlabens spongiae]